MKKGILAIVVAALVAGGVVVGLKMMKSQPGGTTSSGTESTVNELVSSQGQVAIADVIPSDVVLFLSARNARATWDLVKNSNFWKKTSALSLWQGVQVESSLATFKEEFKKNLGFEFSEENLFGLFGQDLSVALIGSKEGLTNPQLLLLAQTDSKADVKGKIAALVEKIKTDVTLETVEYNGQQITRIRNPKVAGPEFNYSVMGSVFALSVGLDDSGLRKVIDLVAKKSSESLGSNAEYKDAVGNLKVRGDLRGLIYVNMMKIVDLIKALPKPEGTPEGFAAGLEQTLGTIRSISGAVGFDKGMQVKLFFSKNKNAGQSEAMAGWESSPKATESLSLLPEDSLILTASNGMDLTKIWDSWQASLEAQSAEQAKLIKEGLATFEKEANVKIKEDILASLGDEICFAVTNVDMTGLFPFPHVAILAKVKDEQKVASVMKTLMDYAVKKSAPTGVSAAPLEGNAATQTADGAPAVVSEKSEGDTTAQEAVTPAPLAPAPSLAQVSLGKEDYQGIEINYLEVQLPFQTLNPSYAIVNQFLIIGVNKDTVKSVIDVMKGGKTAVSGGKNFKEATVNFSEKVNQLGFVNMERTLDLAIQITKWAQKFQKAGGNQETDKMIEQNVVPFLESLRVLKAVAVEAVNQDSGIEETMYIQMEDLKES